MSWLPANWNDALSIPVVMGLPILLVATYALAIPIPEIVVGTLIGGWTLAVQFYYRKSKSESDPLPTVRQVAEARAITHASEGGEKEPGR